VTAVPGGGLDVPIYILGSSLFGAQVAAALGLPFAFASHFAATLMLPAVELYRTTFRPSRTLDQPYVMLGVNVVAADSDDEARFLATSGRQAFASLRQGMPIKLPPPSKAFEKDVVPVDWMRLEAATAISLVGCPDAIESGLRALASRLRPDEIIVVSHIYDHSARVRSYEIVADAGARV
jgi:luciferase family oxidoreductase group 1